VDQRQGMHFEQVFRCARKAGIVSPKTELCHAGFGTMNGKDKKPFKTRDGGVLELNSLIETAFQTALAKVNENIKNNAKISNEEKSDIAEKVAIAAIKFGDLYNHRSRDYIFDIEKFVSFEGKTGPYILYTIARINSIFDNFGELPESFSLKIYSPIEKELVLKILSSENILLKCYEEKAPNYLCERVYEIAAVFNKFYNENKIITETDRQKQNSRLALLALTKECLETLLDLLAIKPVRSM
jgi:arginyl-tRNA synthetase